MDESLQLAAEVAHRILDSQDSRISENSQLFTDLVEMVRGNIRGEPMFPDLEMRRSYPPCRQHFYAFIGGRLAPARIS